MSADEVSRIALPAAGVAFFAICIVWRAWLVRRRIGANPIQRGEPGSTAALVGWWFRVPLALAAVAVLAHATRHEDWLGPIEALRHEAVQWVGLAAIGPGILVVALAQAQMGDSWRVGIGAQRTELVARGLYRFSRNPIYAALSVVECAVFLVSPNAFTLAAVLLQTALKSLQVRLEEEHLERLHGDAYRDYCRRVRRWL